MPEALTEDYPETNLNKFYFYFICLLSFVIPLPYILASVAIIIVSFFWLLNIKKERLHQLKSRKYLWLWIAFFLLHLISYTYSEDKSESLFDLESKLSFLILPIIIGTGPKLNLRHLRIILLTFISSVVLLAIASFAYSGYDFYYIRKDDWSVFFYNEMVRVTEANAVYIAWYTLTSIFILLTLPKDFLKINRFLYVLLLLILQVYFFSLSARLLIIIEALLIVPIAWIAYKKNAGEKLGLIFSIGVIIALFMVGITQNPISNRYKKIAPSNTNDWLIDKNDDSTTQDFTNVTLRLFLWKTAFESIKINKYYYFGCGNGDVIQNQKISIERYHQNLSEGNRKAELWKYNIHNMYLQSLYMLGIPGLLVLCSIIFIPLFFKLEKTIKILGLTFILTSSAFMFIEAALQTQAGIIFFTFFVLLITIFRNNKQTR